MKKIMITALTLGLAIQAASAFTSSDTGEQHDKNTSVMRESVGAMMLGVRSESNGNGMGMNTIVRDDVVLPSIQEPIAIGSVSEEVDRNESSSLSRLKVRGTALIRERINVLQANQKAVEGNKTLTQSQKDALTTIVTHNVTGLTALKLSIASSSDATTTKALVRSIFTDFRIYGIVIPQVRLEKRVYDLQNHSQKLSDLFVKVQAKIDTYKAKGKDVTVWQKNLDDAKVLVANDMNTLANLLPKISGLTPATYGTTSAMIITSANKDIRTVAQDFNGIARTLNKPKSLKAIVGTTTPSGIPVTGTTTATSSSH